MSELMEARVRRMSAGAAGSRRAGQTRRGDRHQAEIAGIAGHAAAVSAAEHDAAADGGADIDDGEIVQLASVAAEQLGHGDRVAVVLDERPAGRARPAAGRRCSKPFQASATASGMSSSRRQLPRLYGMRQTDAGQARLRLGGHCPAQGGDVVADDPQRLLGQSGRPARAGAS